MWPRPEVPEETPRTLTRYVDYNGAVLMENHFVMKRTPRGVWISMGGYPEKKKFVLLYGRKRYAYPTAEEALQSYISRKEWHLVHLARKTAEAQHCLANAQAERIGYSYQRHEAWASDFQD